MEHQFWHNRWRKNEIGFHEQQGNRLLIKHLERLNLSPGDKILVPLCGKTHDIGWLLSQGFQVIGAELVESAIQQLFAQLDIMPNISINGHHKRYQGPGIDVLVGDFFTLTPQQVGAVEAVYDRAALVAMPESMRAKYTEQLTRLSNGAKQLLITFNYDQALVSGPPFAVNAKTVAQHYQQDYQLELVENVALDGGLKGLYPAEEQVWLLQPLASPISKQD